MDINDLTRETLNRANRVWAQCNPDHESDHYRYAVVVLITYSGSNQIAFTSERDAQQFLEDGMGQLVFEEAGRRLGLDLRHELSLQDIERLYAEEAHILKSAGVIVEPEK